MRRREALGGAGALLTLALSGCSDAGEREGDDGGQGPPTPPSEQTPTAADPTTTTPSRPAPNLRVEAFRTEEADEGSLVVVVDVENVAGDLESGVLVVLVGVGDESFRRERRLDVEGDATETYEFEFPVSREAFRDDGRLDFEWEAAQGR